MGMRRFFARMFGFHAAPAATGIQAVYDDALELAKRAYSGKSISRRDMAGRMSQARWTRARQLLKLAGVLDQFGRLDLDEAYTFDEARRRVRGKAQQIQRESRKRNYVSPL